MNIVTVGGFFSTKVRFHGIFRSINYKNRCSCVLSSLYWIFFLHDRLASLIKTSFSTASCKTGRTHLSLLCSCYKFSFIVCGISFKMMGTTYRLPYVSYVLHMISRPCTIYIIIECLHLSDILRSIR